MGLALDASSPAAARGSTATTSTSSFSPPAGTTLVAFVNADANSGATDEACTVTSTGGLSWSLVARHNGAPGATAEVWTAHAEAAPGSITVSVTDNKGAVDKSLFVRVFTGAIPAMTGAVLSGATNSLTLTTQGPGSWCWAVGQDSSATATIVAGTNQTVVDSVTSGGFDGGDDIWTIRQNAITPNAGASVTMNTTTPSSALHFIAVEILASPNPVQGGYTGPAPGRVSPTGQWRPAPAIESPASVTAATGDGTVTAHVSADDTGSKTGQAATAAAQRTAVTATGAKQSAGAGAPAAHTATADTAVKGGIGTAAAVAHATVTATGAAGTPTGPGAAVQRSTVAATGRKQGTAAAASAQHTTTADSTLKQASGAAAPVGHNTTADTGRKQGTGAGSAPTRPASRATTTLVPTGAGTAQAHPATAAAGTAKRAGVAQPAPHPVTAGTGKTGRAGATTTVTHPATTAGGVRAATGAARSAPHAVTVATGFAPPPFTAVLVGLDGAAIGVGDVDGSAAGSVTDGGTAGGTADGAATATGAVDGASAATSTVG